MAWFARLTRFGQVHMCYAQEQVASCGLACCVMVNLRMKSGSVGLRTLAKALFPSLGVITGKLLHPDAKRTAILAEQQVYNMLGGNYTGATDTTGDQLVSILNRLNIGSWQSRSRSTYAISSEMVDAHKGGWPLIIGCSWYQDAEHTKRAGSGHWVVADGVNKFNGKLYANICDPLTGNVHITPFEPGKPFSYDPTDPIGWNAGMDNYRYYAKGYKTKAYGIMDTMVTCTTPPLRILSVG